MPQCTAKAKSTQVQCARSAMTGAPTCRVHGGRALQGALSPHYKHGKYSKSLKGPLLGKYQESVEETKEIMNMEGELHLLDSRIRELAQAVSETDAGSTFEDVGEALLKLRCVLEKNTTSPEKILKSLDEISDMVAVGWDREEQWNEILRTVEIRTKIVTAEVKRFAVSKTSIPVEKVRDFLNKFREIFRQTCLAHVDNTTANAILSDVNARSNRMVGGRF